MAMFRQQDSDSKTNSEPWRTTCRSGGAPANAPLAKLTVFTEVRIYTKNGVAIVRAVKCLAIYDSGVIIAIPTLSPSLKPAPDIQLSDGPFLKFQTFLEFLLHDPSPIDCRP